MTVDFIRLYEQGQEILFTYGIRIITAIAILIIGRIVAGIIKKIVLKSFSKAKVETTISTFISNLTFIGIMAFTIIAVLGRIGVQTTSFIAVLGAAGLAIGLAFQGSLSNFAAGFLMIIFRPFKVDDYIEAAGVAGKVKKIEVFTTTILTVDNKKVIVPNSKITGDNIINYTAEKNRRVDMTFGIGYGDDIDKAKEVLNRIVKSFPEVLEDPAPQIELSELGDSSVNFIVRPWAKTEDYWKVKFGITEAVKKEFDKEGISIPFPQRDVHIYNTEG